MTLGAAGAGVAVSRPAPDAPQDTGNRFVRGLRLEHGLLGLAAAAPISIAASNAFMVAAVVLFTRDWRAGKIGLRPTPVDGALMLWVLANVLSIVTSMEPFHSLRDARNLGCWSVFYLVAWGTAQGVATTERLLVLWLVAGGVAALHALAQWGFGFDLMMRWSPKPTGFFSGHLQFGHSTAVLLGAALAFLTDLRAVRGRAVLAVGTAVLAAALVVSGGRGPWLAFLVIAVAWAWSSRRRAAVAGLALVLVLQVAFLARGPEDLGAYYRSYMVVGSDHDQPPERLHSNLWRLLMWREGLKLFALRPVAGTGIETTGKLSRSFPTPYRDFGVAHLHSNYFEILMTRGFLGLVAFLILIFTALGWLWPALGAAPPGADRAAIFAGVAVLLAHLVHGLSQFTAGSAAIQMGSHFALGLGAGAASRLSVGKPAVAVRVDAVRIAFLAGTAVVLVVLQRFALGLSGLWLVLAGCAAADLLRQLVRRRAAAVEAALGVSFVWVVGAAFLLLAPLQGGLEAALRVVGGAAMPFAVLTAAWRLAGWLR